MRYGYIALLIGALLLMACVPPPMALPPASGTVVLGLPDLVREDEPAPYVLPTGDSAEGAINPLSGLPVEDPELLNNPPALVSISNFPPTARPQAGLSFSPWVFEFFIGEGMTRFLTVFYGQYPQASLPSAEVELSQEVTAGLPQPSIGPIRSGRLPYEHVRKLFNGFIVMASAYSRVATQLNEYVNVYGSDLSDPNSALMPVERLADIAHANRDDLQISALDVNHFSPVVPLGGKHAPSLWVFYSFLNQIFWRYDSQAGAYHRWQNDTDPSNFTVQTDRLNGQPLSYENVIVLFAHHQVQSATLIDVDLLYVNRGKALLFRDGQMHEIYWTTASEEYEKTTGRMRPIRFVDASGDPLPLKPGQTWVHIMPLYVPYWETVDSEIFNQLTAGRSQGSGFWAVYFKLDM